MKVECTDSRFEVRPVHPSEFEIIYDLVDSAFGEKRDRRSYDWIYRDNPCGIAPLPDPDREVLRRSRLGERRVALAHRAGHE